MRRGRRAGLGLLGLVILLAAVGFGLSYQLLASSEPVANVPVDPPAPTAVPELPGSPSPAPVTEPAPAVGVFTSAFDTGGTDWLESWTFRVREPAVGALAQETAETGRSAASARIDVGTASSDWHVQLRRPQIPLEAGTSYTLTFDARADVERILRVAFQREMESYPKYFEQELAVGAAWQSYTVSFTAPETDASAIFNFNFASATGSMWVDNVTLIR